jgi:hypothetical protein
LFKLIRLEFDSHGLLNKFHDLTTGETYSLTQELLYYRGRSLDKRANWGDQPSGAYILHPLQEMRFNDKIDLKIIKVSQINAQLYLSPYYQETAFCFSKINERSEII